MAGLRTVVYRVPDLESGKDWYSKAFKTEPYFDEPFYVGYNIGGYELGLLPFEGEEITHGNSAIAYWAVEDINETINHLIGIGAQVVDEPADVGDGVMVASVKDMWNNIIGLIYNPFFKII